MRWGLVSAKGSPGVTTLALAIAAASDAVVVEADPSGGDVQCWAGSRGEPGLVRVASGARHAADLSTLLDECASEVWRGVRVVVAPAGCEQAESALVALGVRFAGLVEATARPVVVDGGRWDRGQVTADRLAGCDVIGIAVAPTSAGVAHAAVVANQLVESFGSRVVAVPVGERPYPVGEIAASMEVPVVSAVSWDRRGVRSMLAGGLTWWGRRSALLRSTRSMLGQVSLADAEAVG